MPIERTDLGGLRTFHTSAPGPAQAWLVFRVGSADETLFTRGVTRLVAALAVDGLDTGGAAYGHFVGGPTTSIELNGTAEQVTSILRQVCSKLATGGTDRLEQVREREILHSGWRIPSADEHFLALRFGPHGAGLAGQPELGLHHVGAAEVEAWRERYFTVGNAALSLKNVSPGDLDLPPLPEGTRRSLAAPSPRPLPLPAWFEGGSGEIAVSGLLPATSTADAFTSIAVRRLRDRLPEESRDVALWQIRMWPGLDHVVIRCQAPGRSGPRVRDVLLSVLGELAEAGPGAAEIEARRRDVLAWDEAAESVQARIEWAPHGHVVEGGDPAVERDLPERAAVAGAARAFAAGALYQVPPRVLMPASVTFLRGSSPEVVAGPVVARALGDPSGSIVLGDEGVTVTLDGRRVTIRFDRCEAAAKWPDGTLDLYGSDGFGAQIRPGQWSDGAAVAAEIATRLSAVTIVMRPPRSPGR